MTSCSIGCKAQALQGQVRLCMSAAEMHMLRPPLHTLWHSISSRPILPLSPLLIARLRSEAV